MFTPRSSQCVYGSSDVKSQAHSFESAPSQFSYHPPLRSPFENAFNDYCLGGYKERLF